jgi:hypothetical protein
MFGDYEVYQPPSDYNETKPSQAMADVGTRELHLVELYEQWQIALDILERHDKFAASYKEKKEKLEAAIKNLAEYLQKDYPEYKYKGVIDTLPKNAEEIPDTNPNKE